MRKEGILNGERLQQIKSLLEQGVNGSEIGKKLGITRQAIYHHMKKLKQDSNGKSTNESEPIRYNKEKKKYFVNWKIYNEALVKRGEFILFFDLLEQENELLREMNFEKHGKKYQYSNSIIELSRIIELSFGLDLRTTEGICRQLFSLFGLKAPDYTSMCKRFQKLPSELQSYMQSTNEGKEIATDGTGRSQNQRGSYREGKYETPARKYFRVSITVDTKSKQIIVSKTTSQQESEIPSVREAVKETKKLVTVSKVYADRLHDSKDFRGELLEQNIEPVIPAKKTTTVQKAKERIMEIEEKWEIAKQMRKDYIIVGEHQRLKTLVEIVSNYEKWREDNQYGKRSAVENTFSRDTMFFGDSARSKNVSKANKEMKMRFTLLNIFMILAKSKTQIELETVAGMIKSKIRAQGGITARLSMRNRVILNGTA